MEEASVSVGRSEAIGFPSENSQTRLQEEWHKAQPSVIVQLQFSSVAQSCLTVCDP